MKENKISHAGVSAIHSLDAVGLTCSGYTVEAIENESIVWNSLQFETYDLLITDHNLAKISSIEVLTNIRAACLELPVIMGPVAMLPEELNRPRQLIIEAALLKPYTITGLLETVKEALRAGDGARGQIAMPPDRPSQPAPVGLRL